MGGTIGGLLGTSGGAGGTGFSTNNGTDEGQLQTAYTGAQNSLQSQQNLLNALQNQGGLNNQTQTYNQLQGVINGTGPNPAQAQLNQATGANVANQAALMAGQRGAGANVGLMARQVGQQGGALQQQAAGQGASMQAQQSLNAIGAAGNMANTMAGQQIAGTEASTNAQLGEQGILQNANTANNSVQAGLAGTRMQQQGSILGGVGNAVSGALGLLKAHGGEIPAFATGGMAQDPAMGISAPPPPGAGPQSGFAKYLTGMSQPEMRIPDGSADNKGLQEGMAKLGTGIGTKIGALLKPGPAQMPYAGADTSPMEGPGSIGGGMEYAARGGDVGSKLKQGGHVPGKPKVKGDSYANDTVKAMLSPGEVVIPNSVMQSKDPVRGAADFVRAVMAKKGRVA